MLDRAKRKGERRVRFIGDMVQIYRSFLFIDTVCG